MRWLIRRVIKQGKGAVSYEEDVHFGDVLSIGRAADQAIFLSDIRAALNHARVTSLGPGRYKVEALIRSGIRVNGELTYETDVAAGAVLEIASNRITLLDPPRDFEAAVEIGALDKAEQEAVKAKRAKLDLPISVEELARRIEQSGVVELLPVDTQTWLRSLSLPWEPSDPADRVSVATAQIRHLSLLTKDSAIQAFPGVKCIW